MIDDDDDDGGGDASGEGASKQLMLSALEPLAMRMPMGPSGLKQSIVCAQPVVERRSCRGLEVVLDSQWWWVGWARRGGLLQVSPQLPVAIGGRSDQQALPVA